MCRASIGAIHARLIKPCRPLPSRQTPASRRHRLCSLRRIARLRSRVASRIATRARRYRTDGRLRRDDRAHQDRLRRHQQLDSQRGVDRRDVFDARRSGAGPRDVRTRRVVGAACDQGRSQSPQAASGDARDGRSRAPPARDGKGDLQRRVRSSRRHRDRHRARRPLAKECSDLHRRDGHEDDGAVGRDRRRSAAQLSGLARIQPRSDDSPASRSRTRGPHRRTRSTVLNWLFARWTRIVPERWTTRASL